MAPGGPADTNVPGSGRMTCLDFESFQSVAREAEGHTWIDLRGGGTALTNGAVSASVAI